MKKKGVLVYFVNVDWFFVSHRLEIALESKNQGYEVHIIAGFTSHKESLENYGFIVHDINLSRSSKSFLKETKVLFESYRILKKINIDILHLISIKPIIYGGLISKILRIKKIVYSFPGLGHIFTSNSISNYILRVTSLLIYRLILKNKKSYVILQNKHDRDYLLSKKILRKENIIMIYGSGVHLDKFSFSNEPEGIPVVMMISRLLKEKGVIEYLESIDQVKRSFPEVKFVLVGGFDDNPGSLSIRDIEEYIDLNKVEYWGKKENIYDTIKLSSIVVLPSYREGLPKVLIEAGASGKPIVTSDVPGCKDAIIENSTGLLVPPKKINDLSEAIIFLLKNKDIRIQMGKNGRKLAEEKFNIQSVIEKHINIYNS